MHDHPSFVDLLRERARAHPDRLAFSFLQDGENEQESDRWTYASLDRRARTIAARLQQRGLAGQRALLLYNPNLEFVAAFFGCLYADVIAVPAYPPRSAQLVTRLNSIITDAGAAIALTSSALMDTVSRHLGAGEGTIIDCLATDELEVSLADAWQPHSIDPQQLAFLQYTSGSTGSPKGVMVSHGNLLDNSRLINQCFQVSGGSTAVSWLPPYHDMGLVGGILQPLYVGASMILMPPVAFLQRPFRWLSAISRFGASASGGPNFAYDLCIKQIKPGQIGELDLQHWGLAFSGAEPVHAQTLERFCETFGPCGFRREAFLPCYGLAENTLIVSGGRREAAPVVRRFEERALSENLAIQVDSKTVGGSRSLVGSGSAIGAQQVVVVDPERCVPLEAGRIGEIWVRGDSVARGYWNKAELSRDTFAATLAGSEPYLRTGDLGFLQGDELFITGRRKDLIIIRGQNHYPQDLEATVQASHPSLRVGCGAAFSVEDDERGEQLVLVQEVERSALRRLDAPAVTAAIRQAVVEGHQLLPSAILLLKTGAIPKTSSGKIQRFACRQQYLDGTLQVVGEWGASPPQPAPAPPVSRRSEVASGAEERRLRGWFISYLAQLLGLDPASIDIHQPLASFGLDSLAAVRLSADLQDWLAEDRPGQAVPTLSPTLAYDHPTIARIAAFLATDGDGVSSEQVSAGEVPRPERDPQEPIAVVGMGCRFPGAPSPEAFWELLVEGRSGVVHDGDPSWRSRAERGCDQTATEHGGYLEAIDRFDAAFFNVAPREAEHMDPQQRLLLETSWEAFEQAAIPPERWSGTRSGVFVGISSSDYAQLQGRGQTTVYSGTGNAHSIAANRLSYLFDLQGPSLAVDTACSSSLVALHLACRSIATGECEQAIAAGVNVLLSPALTATFRKAGMLSPDGRCKAFDAAADGYVRGEGCGVVLLKRLKDARADGDTIWGVISGSAINQDGRSNGLTAPNGRAQQEVVREALSRAALQPADLSYVEAHGTGTSLGDPIELNALKQELGRGRSGDGTCWIGSVKTNLGHLEAAAGIAGVIKTLLSLTHRRIPAHLNFAELNPLIDLQDTPFKVPTESVPWAGGVRHAGVSSFGFGGTNAHVILSSPPAAVPATAEVTAAPPERPWHLLTLSARSRDALQELCRSHAAQLEEAAGGQADAALADHCFTANAGRAQLPFRAACLARSRPALARVLRSGPDGQPGDSDADGIRFADTQVKGSPPPVAFLFTGQGSQYVGMGRELHATQPLVRSLIDRADQVLRAAGEVPEPWVSLQEILFGAPGDDTGASDRAAPLHRTRHTQPALFALEVALGRLWQSWGVEPDWLMGHSVGELAAACIADVFSFEDGLRLISARARLMHEVTGSGAMLSVFAGSAEVMAEVERLGEPLVIGAFNGPKHVVLSGETGAIERVDTALEVRGFSSRRLQVSQAFHSPRMAPMVEAFRTVAESITYRSPRLPVISNITHGPAGEAMASADYWCRHVLEPVHFAQSMETLTRQGVGVFLEIGPRPTLLAMGRRCCGDAGAAPADRNEPIWLPSLQPGRSDSAVMLQSLAQLHNLGQPIDWQGFDRPFHRRRVSLPTYPWQRRRHWIEGLGRSTPQPQPQPEAQPPSGALLHGIEWWPAPLPPLEAAAPVRPGRWLLLAPVAWAAAFQEQLPTAQLCCRLEPAAALAQPGPEHWQFDPTDAGHWQQLIEALSSDADCPVLGILAVLEPAGTAPDIAALRLSSHRLPVLAQAVLSSRWAAGPPRLWMVSSPPDPTDLAQGLQQGFARTLALEHPEIWGGLVDLHDPLVPASQAMLQRDLQQSLEIPPSELQISLGLGRRSVARLVPTAGLLAPEVPAPGTAADFLVQGDGHVLISGGLGALGRTTAQWLIDRGVRSLILLGRREPDADLQQRIDAWTRRGLTVTLIRSDISDAKTLEHIRGWIAASGRPLQGIVHAAGVLDDAAIHALTPEQWDAVLRPKIEGAWHLHELSLDHPVRFFVLFSSLAAVLGSPGQSHYAAANAALDALAAHRRAEGLPALSLNWGPWAQEGMAARMASRGPLRAAGLRPIPPGRCLALLEDLLRSAAADRPLPASLSVLEADWAQLLQSLRGRPQASFLEGFSDPMALADATADIRPEARTEAPADLKGAALPLKRELLALSPPERPGVLRDYLLSTLAALLGVPQHTIQPEAHLLEAGADSLMVMDAITRIQRDFDLMVYPREVYEHPRISDLATYLAAEFDRLHGAAPSQPASEWTSPTAVAGTVWGAPRSPLPEVDVKLPKACFILSSPRAGSTLLRVMLAGHPQLLSPPELHLLPFASMRERARDLAESHLGEGLQRVLMDLSGLSAEESLSQVERWEREAMPISAVYGRLQELAGDRLLVDKSPSYAMNLEVLERLPALFEDVRVIHLVRHPLAMIQSFVKLRMDRLIGAGGDDPHRLAEEIWTRSNRNVLHLEAQLEKDQLFRLRYEDLVSSPEEALRPLCAFLDIPFDSSLLTPYRGERLTDGLHHQSLGVGDPNFLRHRGIDASLATRWKDVELPRPLAGETIQLARQFHYDLPTSAAAPAALPGPGPRSSTAAREISLRGAGGLELGGCEWGPTEGPPVLCLHGILDQGLIWDQVAQPLAAEGLRVIAPDLRGHGLSQPVGSGSSYQLMDFLADVVAVFEAQTDSPAVLVGHSLGSVLAGVLAGVRADRVRHLLLVEPVLPAPPRDGDALPAIETLLEYRMVSPRHRAMADLEQAAGRLRQAIPSLPQPFARRLAQRGTRAEGGGLIWRWDPVLQSRTSLTLQNGPLSRTSYLELLAGLELPVTTMHGRSSAFNRPEDLEALQQALPRARRLMVAGGHHLAIDAPADLVTEILAAAGAAPEQDRRRAPTADLVASPRRPAG